MPENLETVLEQNTQLIVILGALAGLLAVALIVALAAVAWLILRQRRGGADAAGSGAGSAPTTPSTSPQSDAGLKHLTDSVDAMRKSLRKSETARDHERSLLHAMMDNLPDSIYFKDTQSRFIMISRALSEKFGIDHPSAAAGKTDADFFTKEHAQQALRDEQELMRTGRPVVGLEEKETWADGHDTWASTTKMCLRDRDGRLLGTFGISRDITEKKQAEEAMHRAQLAAEEANRAKSDFLANMSHEIRTPMNGIIGMTEVLLNTELRSDQREYALLVKSSADALLQLLNDILDFSKIEAGKLELEYHPFHLRDSIGDTLQTLAIRAAGKGLELAYHIPPDIPDRLVGDLGRLRQILVNLVGNAIKFTEQGEVVVKVNVESKSASELVLHFGVSDTGMGILPEKQDMIFESFSQADTSTTRKFGGTGLGLTISRQLTEMMGGRLWLDSEFGIGSTFHFTGRFGLAPASEQPSAPAPETLHGLRVLIVDDNQTNRLILDEMLRNWELRPDVARSGPEALKRLESALPDDPFKLILLDFMMPDMDGLAFARSISREDKLGRPTIIMLTSAGHPPSAADLRETGIARCLTKPIKQSDLLDAIGETLGVCTRDRSKQSKPAASRLSHLRILMAEDGRVNQVVALNLLEEQGHVVTVAQNGREAVEAYSPGKFDAILMDVQMPEMNGYEATTAIRQSEKATGRHVPIIAMTANAMKGDRERCLEAGMDAYVAKPIRSEDLFAALESVVIPSQGTEAEAAEQAGAERSDSGKVPDDTALETKSPIKADGENADADADSTRLFDAERFRQGSGSRSLMLELIGIYQEDVDPLLKRIRDGITAGEAPSTHEAAHALKGLLGNFASAAALDAATALDDAARRGDLDSARAALPAVEGTASALEARLTVLRNELSSDDEDSGR